MKKLTLEEIRHITKLANLEINEKDLKKFANQLSEVIDFNASRLDKEDVKGVEPAAYVGNPSVQLREDEPETGLTQDETLKNAPESHNGFVKVKAVLEVKE